MARSVLVDAGFIVALLSRRDANHHWAVAEAPRLAPPWRTCEPALSQACHLLGTDGMRSVAALVRRRAIVCAFRFTDEVDAVLRLLEKYADVPIGATAGTPFPASSRVDVKRKQ